MTPHWTPSAGWDEYFRAFLSAVPFEHLDAAEQVLRHCRLCGRKPTQLFKDWCYWGGIDFDRWPPGWRAHLEWTDWESFAAFVANETAANRAKILNLNPSEVQR